MQIDVDGCRAGDIQTAVTGLAKSPGRKLKAKAGTNGVNGFRSKMYHRGAQNCTEARSIECEKVALTPPFRFTLTHTHSLALSCLNILNVSLLLSALSLLEGFEELDMPAGAVPAPTSCLPCCSMVFDAVRCHKFESVLDIFGLQNPFRNLVSSKPFPQHFSRTSFNELNLFLVPLELDV